MRIRPATKLLAMLAASDLNESEIIEALDSVRRLSNEQFLSALYDFDNLTQQRYKSSLEKIPTPSAGRISSPSANADSPASMAYELYRLAKDLGLPPQRATREILASARLTSKEVGLPLNPGKMGLKRWLEKLSRRARPEQLLESITTMGRAARKDNNPWPLREK
jgi:hypothetical protein